MDTKVESFLKKQEEIINEDRDKKLIELGLIEKEYAPDGKQSHIYSEYEYVGGEQKFYHKVAIKVTDEEWKKILERSKAVAEIKERENEVYAKKKYEQESRLIQKFVPTFVKPKDEFSSSSNAETVETGKSKLASTMRIIAWVICILNIMFVFITALDFAVIISTVIHMTIFMLAVYGLSGILDYLAEISATLRGGYKYTKSSK